MEDPGSDFFEGLNLNDLKIDQAYVRVRRSEATNETDSPLWLYQLSDDCHEVIIFGFIAPPSFLAVLISKERVWCKASIFLLGD